MTSVTGRLELDRLAGLIHDDILQSLGVCVLGAELSRISARKGQRTEAVAELDEALAALRSVMERSRGVLVELRRVARWLPVYATVPRAEVASAAEAGRVQPDQLVRALGDCLVQAERCHDFYRRDDEGAIEALGGLLDQLEDVAAAFRQVMSELHRAGPPPPRGAPHST